MGSTPQFAQKCNFENIPSIVRFAILTMYILPQCRFMIEDVDNDDDEIDENDNDHDDCGGGDHDDCVEENDGASGCSPLNLCRSELS